MLASSNILATLWFLDLGSLIWGFRVRNPLLWLPRFGASRKEASKGSPTTQLLAHAFDA